MDEASAFTRIPPHSSEAEESIVGACLLERQAHDRVASLIGPDDFYIERNARIYAAMSDLAEHGLPLDVVTVAERLKARGELARVGGATYVAELSEKVVTAANVEYYAQIVREKAVLRRLIQVSTRITQEAYEARGDVEDFIDRAETEVFAVSDRSRTSGLERIDKLIPETVARIEFLYERKEEVTGVPSGFTDLDRLTAGFQPSDLIIVAGRPSMGKTAFCLNIAENAAMSEEGCGVAIFSMEMSREQLVMRMLCSQAELDNSRVRTGHLADRDIKKLALTAGRLGMARIFIDDAPAQKVNDLRAKARRLRNDPDAKLGLIVVDYLQLMRGGGEDSREQEISAISRSLKALAKELNVPIIALSQLNRQVELRADKRPVMADLRESGAIEQDADVIAFIYRDEQYNPETPEPGVAEIIISKQRNGPTGTARMMFDKKFARFRNFTSRDDGIGMADDESGY
jgi:replicative DNA helicase